MKRPPIVGRIEAKLSLAFVLAAAVPLVVSGFLVNRFLEETLAVGINEDVRNHIERTTELYTEYFAAKRALQDALAAALVEALSHDAGERASAPWVGAARAEAALRRLVGDQPDCVEASLVGADGTVIVHAARPHPPAPESVHVREVELPAGSGEVVRFRFVLATSYYDEFDYAETKLLPVYTALQARYADIGFYFTLGFVAVLFVVIGIGTAAGILVARRVTRRIIGLMPATRRVAAGDLDVAVDEEGEDEIGDLSRAFNRMVREMQASRARIEYLQKIGAWQQIARRLAHEIKNPLTPIHLAVQELHRKYAGGDEKFRKLLDEAAEVVEEEVRSLRALVEEFSDFARLPEATPLPDDLRAWTADFVASCPKFGEGAEVVLEPDGAAAAPALPVPALIDRLMLRRALTNLVKNAVEAMNGSGRVDLSVGVAAGRPYVVVADRGHGVVASDRERMFDPYFTTKEHGTGLGLAIVKRIVFEHGGETEVRDRPGGGCEVCVFLQPPSP
jgi:nitrogen fixation/metabolism regulation signal transduction histidine kinase